VKKEKAENNTIDFEKIILNITLLIPAIFIVILLLSITTMTCIGAGDTWWYLACGRYIVENRTVPQTDVFSHTFYGKEWINSEWLTNVVFYLIFSAFGREGLAVYKIIMVIIIFSLILFRVYRKTSDYRYVLICLFILSFVGRIFLDIRAQLSTFIFINICILLFDLYREGKRWVIYIIPVMMIPWVNLHGGYIYIFFILGCYFLGEIVDRFMEKYNKEDKKQKDEKRVNSIMIWPLLMAICFFICLINPYNIRVYEFPFKILHQPSFKDTLEWLPPLTWKYPFYSEIMAFTCPSIYIPYAIVFVIFSILSWRRLYMGEFFISYLTLFMSISSRRFIPLFIFVSAPLLCQAFSITAGNVIRQIENNNTVMFFKKNNRIISLSVMMIAVLYLYGYIFYMKIIPGVIASGSLFNYMTVDYSFPASSCEFLKANKIKGKLLNYYNWGGYIYWHLFPDTPGFIDGRAHGVYDEKLYDEYKLLGSKDGWLEFDDGGMKVLEKGLTKNKFTLIRSMKDRVFTPESITAKLRALNFQEDEIEFVKKLMIRVNWEKIADQYNIDIIFINKYVNNDLAQLVIQRGDKWYFVYQDNNTLIFLRRNDTNRMIVEKLIKGELFIPEEAKNYYKQEGK